MNIPFLDLAAPHIELEEELIAVVRKALRTAHFVGGEEVDSFEKEWAAYCGARYAIGVSSGTDALRFALLAAGIGKGDTVVTVPNTFIATTEAISQTGAGIAFVDIDERTYNLDPKKLEEYLETHAPVKAVIPVHLYGQMCDMDAILGLAGKYGFTVIEDACQAHGAEYFSKKQNRRFKAGSMGRAAAFSFYPGKNLGACGEGGAVTTGDPEIAQRVRMLRDHGQAKKYYHDFEGYNGRLDAIQAGFLRVKLRRLDEWNAGRRAAATRYAELLSGTPAILPYEPEWSRAIYHLFVIRLAGRDALQTQLNAAGVGTGLHYPVPLHLQNAYGYQSGSFPVTERVASEILSLPMFPQLTSEMQRRIAALIEEFHFVRSV
jgi:dTDP-4-amino-4,6-dideoxygalactose transaminase